MKKFEEIKNAFSFIVSFFVIFISTNTLSTSSLSLNQALELAFKNNLDLKEKQEEVGIATGNKQKLSALFPSSPQINLEYQTDKPFADQGQKSVEISLTQEIEIGGQQFLRNKIGKLHLEQAQKDFSRSEQILAYQVKKLFYENLYLEQRKAVLKTLNSTTAQFSKNAKKRKEDNSITSFESDLWQMEYAGTTLDLQNTISDLNKNRLELAKTLGITEEEIGLIKGQFPTLKTIPSEEDLLNLAKDNRLDLKKMNLQVAEKNKAYAFSKRALIPNPQISVGYIQDTSVISGSDFNGNTATTSSLGDSKTTDKFLKLGVSINLPIFSGYRGELTKAKHEKQLATLQKQNFERQIEVEVKTLRQRLIGIKTALSQFQEGAGHINENLNQLSQAYQNGNIDYNDFLANQDRLIKAKLQYLDARWTMTEIQLDMELATGLVKGDTP